MEYLQPIKTLEGKVTLYRNLLIATVAILIVALIAIPASVSQGNPVLVQSADRVTIAKNEPWNLSVLRIEEFLKQYIRSRFQWNEGNFDEQKKNLKSLVSDAVFTRLKDSLSAFESLNKNHKARSDFVLEGYGFSNEKHKIEARIIRVLHIGKVAAATPLTIQISYQDTAITPDNPYGLVVTGLTESDGGQ